MIMRKNRERAVYEENSCFKKYSRMNKRIDDDRSLNRYPFHVCISVPVISIYCPFYGLLTSCYISHCSHFHSRLFSVSQYHRRRRLVVRFGNKEQIYGQMIMASC